MCNLCVGRLRLQDAYHDLFFPFLQEVDTFFVSTKEFSKVFTRRHNVIVELSDDIWDAFKLLLVLFFLII